MTGPARRRIIQDITLLIRRRYPRQVLNDDIAQELKLESAQVRKAVLNYMKSYPQGGITEVAPYVYVAVEGTFDPQHARSLPAPTSAVPMTTGYSRGVGGRGETVALPTVTAPTFHFIAEGADGVPGRDPPAAARTATGGNAMSFPHFSLDCAEYHGLVRDFGGPRPRIVVLCGSTRFKDAWYEQGRRLTHEGNIVLSVGDLDTSSATRHTNVPIDPELKARLDELHKRKIDLADEVLVLNVGGYIGDSTRSEIEYAEKLGKPVHYLEVL